MKHLATAIFATFVLAGTAKADTHDGVRGLEHVAITVPQLATARAFFEDGLGCQSVFDLGPFKDETGSWMADFIGTDPRAEMVIAVMKCGNASIVELMEISSPSQNTTMPRRDDIGSASLGFYVDDLEGSIARIESAGGKSLGSITSINTGPEEGRRFIYTVSPWGQMIFLLNDGDGTAYSRQENAVSLFSPADLPVD